jgi:hypothetical protein
LWPSWHCRVAAILPPWRLRAAGSKQAIHPLARAHYPLRDPKNALRLDGEIPETIR